MMNNAKLARFPRSKIWDERTQQIIDGLRAFIHREPQPTVSYIQDESTKARPIKGPFRARRDVLQAPAEDDVRQLLFEAITDLGDAEYEPPELAHVPVEWIFNDPSAVVPEHPAKGNSPLPEQHPGLTILHVHGGAFFQGSPSAYRPTTTKLASSSGGRVVSVKYRLAPQHLFPAPQLDVLVAYLSLLYPHPSSDTSPLCASQVVFAGDSCGGSLLYNVLQIIQQTAMHEPIKFHSHTVSFPLPKPAGIATLSLAGEQLRCFPSQMDNLVNDLYLNTPPWSLPEYPACALWPPDPPRPMIHANIKSFAHPLQAISLQSSWTDAPPMWFAVGEEQLIDSSKAVARRAARDGVTVTWTQFEAMPHCFAALPGLNRFKQAKLCFELWGRFCRGCVEGYKRPGPRVTAMMIGFKEADEKPLELDGEAEEKRLPLIDLERRVRDEIDKVEKSFAFARRSKL